MKKYTLLSLGLLLAATIYGQKETVSIHQDFPTSTESILEVEKPIFNTDPLSFTHTELNLPEGFELIEDKVITSKTALHYHYGVEYNGVKVYGVNVHTVVSHDQSVKRIIHNTIPSIITTEEGFPINRSQQLRTKQGASEVKNDEPVWIIKENKLVPARLTELVTENELHQEVIYSGQGILFTIDKIKKHHHAGPNDTTVQGYVFAPDPLTTAQVNYGASYKDNNDADASSLNNERELRSFTASFENGIFVLKNDFVQISDLSPPSVAPVTNTTGNFLYTRSQDGFEDVNVLYHISNHKQHLDALGFSNLPGYTIHIDPHALGGSDNSYFYTSSNPYRILMGEGGVDDAEDADVIIHEYTHAYVLAASNNNNGSVERNTIEESLGDYFAASYSRSVNDFNKERVFTWDGHNEFWGGRWVESQKDYKQIQFGSNIYSHTDIFASPLMEIYGIIGRNTTDEIVMEAIFNLGQNTTMPQMAMHIIQADQALNGGVNYKVIVDAFVRRSILDPSIGLATFNASGSLQISGTHEFALGGALQVKAPEKSINEYTIYTLSGKPLESKVLGEPLQMLLIESTGLASGVYLLKVGLKEGYSVTYKVSRF
ncbi:MAG: hypothetical protein ACPF9D_07085 [Owenweeksia sp.]